MLINRVKIKMRFTEITILGGSTRKMKEMTFIVHSKCAVYIRVILYWGYFMVLWLLQLGLSCTVFNLYCVPFIFFVTCVCVCVCVCVYMFCNVWVYCNTYTITLAGGFPCFLLSCKANARVKLAKTGHGPRSSKLVIICVVFMLIVLFHVLFVCKCVLYYCYRVFIQLQLTNKSSLNFNLVLLTNMSFCLVIVILIWHRAYVFYGYQIS